MPQLYLTPMFSQAQPLRIPLRQSDPAMLESCGVYRRSSANEADIELSSALDAAYFRRD